MVLALAYQVSLIDGKKIEQAQILIDDLAGYLKIDPIAHNQIRLKYSLEVLKTPYTVLDIEPTADAIEIKKAYRSKLREVHPDRFVHLGDERVEEAHMKFLEVQSAFQELKNIRGIKI